MREIDERHLNNGEKDVNWSDLADAPLSLVGRKLMTNIVDFIRFGSICLSWRSIYGGILDCNQYPIPPQISLLMINSANDDGNYRNLSFYSLSEKRHSHYRAELPQNKVCRGSSHGWLFLVDTVSFDILLFNPFLSDNNEIQLPPFTAYIRASDHLDSSNCYPVKVALSANPRSNPDYLVLAIFSQDHHLAFFKPGNETWTFLGTPKPFYSDITFHKDQFYALTDCTEACICNLINDDHTVQSLAPALDYDWGSSLQYIVGSSENLLLVKAEANYFYSKLIRGFKVFKLDPVGLNWVELNDLDGRVLFVGGNASMSLSAVDLPGCRSNSIYFTDGFYGWFDPSMPEESDSDKLLSPEDSDSDEYLNLSPEEEFYDIGVFRMEDHSIERFYEMKRNKKYSSFSPPIWVQPTLQRH